jgi:two-component system, OmpR family, heavy metal sensor histidine kinase CusS
MNLSFRWRIALLASLLSGLVLAAFGAAALAVAHGQKIAALDAEIRSFGARLPGRPGGRGSIQRLRQTTDLVFGEGRGGLLAIGGDGEELFRSETWPWPAGDEPPLPVLPPLPPSPPAAGPALSPGFGGPPGSGLGGPGGPGGRGGHGQGMLWEPVPAAFRNADAAGRSWRLGALQAPDAVLRVALPLDATRAELRALALRFGLLLVPGLALIAWSGWWIAGRALAPLDNISDAAGRIVAGELDQRIRGAPATPEIDHLIRILNDMLDKLEAARHQAARFSADASHELKTPVAAMQAAIEDALRHAPPGSGIEALALGLAEDTARLKSIVDALLLLARADSGGIAAARVPCDLAGLAAECIEDWEPLAEAAGISLRLAPERPPPVLADPALLRRALGNLLDNAIKYNQPGGDVELRLGTHDGRVFAEVANTGAAIPADVADKIFERFYRGPAAAGSPPPGQGLGLSLAREIARAMGGDLVLVPPAGDRTTFRLSLPTA